MPWTKSMLNDSNNMSNNLTNFCNDDGDLKYGEEFANAASQYQCPGCPGLKHETVIRKYFSISNSKIDALA